MSLRLNGNTLVSDTVGTEYRVQQPFQQVLESLRSDSVPQALFMLGILTEQLSSEEVDTEKRVQFVKNHVNDVPAITVPSETVNEATLFLGNVQESLSQERRQTVEELLKKSNFEFPDSAESSTNSSRTGDKSNTTESDKTGTSITTSESSNSSKTHKYSTTAKSKSFSCEFCDASFSSERSLTSHSIKCNSRPKGTRFRCEQCKNEYVSKGALSRHLKDCNSTKTPYNCDDCNKVFHSRDKFAKHACASARQTSKTRSTAKSKSKVAQQDVTGIVDEFHSEKGYGFISESNLNQNHSHRSRPSSDQNQNPPDSIFFHISKYPKQAARIGDQLQFDVEKTDKGPQATNITIKKRAPPSSNSRKRIEPWNISTASQRLRWGKDT